MTLGWNSGVASKICWWTLWLFGFRCGFLMFSAPITEGFVLRPNTFRKKSLDRPLLRNLQARFHQLSLGKNDDYELSDRKDDEGDSEMKNGGKSFDEGQELAKQFYQFQKKSGLESDVQRPQPPQPPSAAPKSQNMDTNGRPIKFTGRPPRSSLFSSEDNDDNKSNNNDPATRTTRTTTSWRREQAQREFDLAANVERTLPIQAAVVAFSLAFVLYIGMTGGIPSSSDSSFDGNAPDDVTGTIMDDDFSSYDWEEQNRRVILEQLGTTTTKPTSEGPSNTQVGGDGTKSSNENNYELPEFFKIKTTSESVWL